MFAVHLFLFDFERVLVRGKGGRMEGERLLGVPGYCSHDDDDVDGVDDGDGDDDGAHGDDDVDDGDGADGEEEEGDNEGVWY